MAVAIHIAHVKKAYENNVVIHDLTADIKPGELFTLLGPSGCGKTTLLRMIAGFNSIEAGTIAFDDKVINNVPVYKRNFGMVFQSYAIFPNMTVYRNIEYGLKNKKLPKAEIKRRVEEIMATVQISQYRDRYPNKLSGGQQQRVALARAIVVQPQVLLMDEPLSNLDARLRLQTREEIRRIQRETKITTVFVTHDQDEAMSISDFIVVMKAGVVQQIGKPQAVYDDPDNLFVAKFLGTPPINVFNGAVKGGKVYIGEEAVLSVNGVNDGEVYVGIRPEGFILDENGPLGCKLINVEVMGRDVSVVSSNPASLNPTIRSIINADAGVDHDAETVRFSVKPHKLFLFDKESEKRIRFEVK